MFIHLSTSFQSILLWLSSCHTCCADSPLSLWPSYAIRPEISYQFGAPMQQISTGFTSCLRYCSDVAHRRPTKLCTMFSHFLGWYTIYTFLGLLPGAKFTLHPILALSYIISVTARHSSSGRQPNFAALSRCRLYLAGRPSRWALAHILVCICFPVLIGLSPAYSIRGSFGLRQIQ